MIPAVLFFNNNAFLACFEKRERKEGETDEIGLKFVKRSGWGVDVMIGLTLTPPPPTRIRFIHSFDAVL